MFDFLKPRWKKDAKHLVKGAKKFLHYKRDLLSEDRIAEVESRRADLRDCVKRGDRKAAVEAGKQLQATCDKLVSTRYHQTWWEENLEVLFVALVIALGLRAYVLQPFRIPTGSMQPTLNGITVHRGGEDFDKPWFGQRWVEFLWRGRVYKKYVAESDMRLQPFAENQPGRPASWFLFTRTAYEFDNGQVIKVPAEMSESINVFREENGIRENYRAGETIFNGWIDSGDLVLVDKMSYHFRKPDRGEVFVFDTRAITTSGDVNAALRSQTGGSHYIKRLCGLPGDALSIEPPYLYVNGKIAEEKWIRRVMEREGEYGGPGRPGYVPADSNDAYGTQPLDEVGEVFKLRESERVGMSEYAALGDNTANSLDSRYWGAVREFNLSGPGWFSLWPFGSGHWGLIE